MSHLRHYLASRLVQAGLLVLVLGTGPLLLIIVAATLGLTRDPNPNPIGPGMLAMLTFWPGVILTVIGLTRQHRRLPDAMAARDDAMGGPADAMVGSAGAMSEPVSTAGSGIDLERIQAVLATPAVRLVIGVLAIVLGVKGYSSLETDPSRGAASLMIIAFAMLYWGVFGRFPRFLLRRRQRRYWRI